MVRLSLQLKHCLRFLIFLNISMYSVTWEGKVADFFVILGGKQSTMPKNILITQLPLVIVMIFMTILCQVDHSRRRKVEWGMFRRA